MATKSKDSNVGKKEKVVTPSSSQATKTSSTKPLGSSTHKASSAASSQGSTEKQIPNYLKPTISSRHESPAGPKPTLNRRRSFDNKPPSLSRAPTKASPPERVVQPSRSTTKSAPLRSTARGTGTKPQLLHAKSAKKGMGDSLGRKEGPSPKDSTVLSREVQGSEVADQTYHHDDHHTTLADQGVQVAPDQDELKSEDHDHDHEVVNDDHSHGHDEDKDKISDITVSEELVVKSEDDHDHDDHSDNAGIEERNIDHEKLEINEVEEEKSEDHSEPNETPNESTTIEEELVKEEDIKEESEDKLETNNKTNNDDDDDNDNDNGDQVNGKELGEDNNDEKEAKSEAKKAQTQSGKKESQIAYNDVIEETASKLLEKRNNKVKALVGAFETVIDYESK